MTSPSSHNKDNRKSPTAEHSDAFSELSQARIPEPTNSGYLARPGKVGHEIYFEEYGDPSDPPLLLVHGTALPFNGSQLSFLNELKVRAVVFHQRGVGNSKPSGEILENNLDATIADVEAIRSHLAIDSWHVLGWSLGTTYSLSYAKHFPETCKSLVLAGVFLGNQQEYERVLEADFRGNPMKFQRMAEYLEMDFSQSSLAQIIERTAKLFHSPDPKVAREAISMWETGEADQQIDVARQNYLEVNFHYKVNNYFVDPNETLGKLDTILHMPIRILSGSEDYVVMPESSEALNRQLNDAERTGRRVPDVLMTTTESDHFFQSPSAQEALAAQVKDAIARSSHLM